MLRTRTEKIGICEITVYRSCRMTVRNKLGSASEKAIVAHFTVLLREGLPRLHTLRKEQDCITARL
jgi:hypothetical protein